MRQRHYCFEHVDFMEVYGEAAECEECGAIVETGYLDGEFDTVLCSKCFNREDDDDAYIRGIHSLPAETHDPCKGCGGEDCACCEVWLERQADSRSIPDDVYNPYEW